jgi:hypothetical protein
VELLLADAARHGMVVCDDLRERCSLCDGHDLRELEALRGELADALLTPVWAVREAGGASLRAVYAGVKDGRVH